MTDPFPQRSLLADHSRRSDQASILAYFIGFAGLGLSAGLVGPSLATLAANTNVTLAQIGILFSIRALGGLLGSVFIGRFYDSIPGHRIAIGGLLLTAAALVGVPLAASLIFLAALFFALGLADGALLTGYNTLIIWIKPRGAGRRVNALHFFFGAGAMIGPLLVTASLARSQQVSWAFWATALFSVFVGLILTLNPSPPIPAGNQDSRQNSRRNLGLVALFLVFIFFYVGGELSFASWIFTYASLGGRSGVESSLALAAWVNSAFWAALTLGRLFATLLTARLRLETILQISLSGMLISGLVLLFFPLPQLAMVIGTVGLGLFMAAVFPTLVSVADERLGMSGSLSGWFFGAGAIAGMTWPWLTGLGIDTLGVGAMPWLVTGLVVVQLLLFTRLRKST